MNNEKQKEKDKKISKDKEIVITQNKGITMKNAKTKYFAIFVMEVNESYSFVKMKRINPIKRQVRYAKDKLFILQSERPTYINGLKVYYFFDLQCGQLLFNKTSDDSLINSDIIDNIMCKNIVNQLTSSLMASKFTMNLVMMLFAGIFGGLIGYLIGVGGYA